MKINSTVLWTIISILGVGGMIYAANINKNKHDKNKDNKNKDDINKDDNNYDPTGKDFNSFKAQEKREEEALNSSYDKAIKSSEEAYLAAEKAFLASKTAYERSIAAEKMDVAQKNINESKKLRVHSGGRANKKTKKIKLN
jgi:hypothetical protein